LRVIAAIEHQGYVRFLSEDLSISFPECIDNVSKLLAVRLVSLIDFIKQGNLFIGRHEQRQANNPQIRALLFAVPPLGHTRLLIGRVYKCEEVGRVINNATGCQLVLLNQLPGEAGFKLIHLLLCPIVHVIPEPLAAQLLFGTRYQPA